MENPMPEMSEQFDIVAKQLMLAKKEMGSIVKKDSENPFHRSKYASLSAHLQLCENALDKYGLILLQNGNVIAGLPILISTLYHPESGQWMKSYLPLPNPKNDSQGIGSSISYMRRYSINSMFGLRAEDDDGESSCIRDEIEPKKPPYQGPPPKPNYEVISSKELSVLNGLKCQLTEKRRAAFLKWVKESYKCNNLEELPKKAFEACAHALNLEVKKVA